MQPPNLLNLITKDKAKTIISIRNFDIIKYRYAKSYFLRLEHIFFNYFIKKADTIVTVSEELKETTVKTYHIQEEKVITIYNGCDIDRIKDLSQSAIDDEIMPIFEDPVIINVGKLEPQKGQIQLIKVFKKLKNKIPELRLIILGKGSLKSELIEYAHYLKLKVLDFEINRSYGNEDLVFLGFIDNPYHLLKNSKLFVLSSHYEGFPNVIIEAMACGTPIASSNCPSGPKEILIDREDTKKKYGLLLPILENVDLNEKITSYEEEIWLDSIHQLLTDEVKRSKYRDKSYERVKYFSLKKLVNNWNNVIISRLN
jgi:glycosyltransferase involved in cell wall biosynthesis